MTARQLDRPRQTSTDRTTDLDRAEPIRTTSLFECPRHFGAKRSGWHGGAIHERHCSFGLFVRALVDLLLWLLLWLLRFSHGRRGLACRCHAAGAGRHSRQAHYCQPATLAALPPHPPHPLLPRRRYPTSAASAARSQTAPAPKPEDSSLLTGKRPEDSSLLEPPCARPAHGHATGLSFRSKCPPRRRGGFMQLRWFRIRDVCHSGMCGSLG